MTERRSLRLERGREMLAVIALERHGPPARVASLHVEVDGARVPHAVRDDLQPSCIVARIPARAGQTGPGELAVVSAGGLDLAALSIFVIPASPALPARFPPTRLQRLKRRLGLSRRDNGQGDFPLSHFDGLAYLRAYPEVDEAVRARRVPSALEHYIRHGHAEGRRFSLAADGLPSAGTLEQLLKPDFDGLAYLRAHPDVRWGVRRQEFPSALHHYLHHGAAEGRSLPTTSSENARVGNLYDLLHEELEWRTQEIKTELWKGFDASIAHLREGTTFDINELRSGLATTRVQLDGLKAALVSAADRARIERPRLYIDVQHGLGNRLKSLVSASVLAEKIGRELVLVWVPDHHCQCRMADLFEYDGPVVSEPMEVDRGKVRVYNYMEIEPGGRKDEPIDLETPSDIYVRSAYPLNTLLTDWNAENRVLRALRPVAQVRDLVGSIDVAGRAGVHIRMEAGAGMDANSYDSSANWSEESHRLIQSWRAKSHYTNFMRRIDALLKEDPGLRLFLAADRAETYRVFQEAYGDRLAFLLRPAYDRSREQLVHALADAILLGRCARFLGSTYSTFSELAIRYSTGYSSIEMSGRDF